MYIVGGSVVGYVPCVRTIEVSNPTLGPHRDLGQVIHSQFLVALRRINSDTVSMLLLGAPLRGLEEALTEYTECE